jgi:hypothetical protein
MTSHGVSPIVIVIDFVRFFSILCSISLFSFISTSFPFVLLFRFGSYSELLFFSLFMI